MKHNLIYTENYILLVSDEEIKAKDFYLAESIIECCSCKEEANDLTDLCKKIIAHLPLNGASYLDGIDVLPKIEIENEVEGLAKEFALKHSIYPTAQDDTEYGFKAGYNKAKETYKYTEEDLIRAMVIGIATEREKGDYTFEFNEFIKDLNQPKQPIAFQCEEETYMYSVNGDIIKPKTITNAQGRVELVGTYIFE